ncbi:TetR family transcriptional regulator [Streptomyces sp. NPDC004539]|uniref:TetR family transcriptional regulator n=1 Tax=Streptomyces sp. NPDC004539 TaxID=3154280 RepID=UPI0033BC432B
MTSQPDPASEATRERIVSAATTEFARYGIAGARIDRIAKAAKTSKERVYAYFRGKEKLYSFVSGRELAAVTEAARMDPADLPGYAGRIHDYFIAHPERHRLMMWGQLELDPNATPAEDNPMQQSLMAKTEQLRQAQQDGRLDPSWNPLDVLVLVNQIASAWAMQPDLAATVPAAERSDFLAARRSAIVAAVERVFPAVQTSPSEKH